MQGWHGSKEGYIKPADITLGSLPRWELKHSHRLEC